MISLFSYNLIAKEVTEYECLVPPDLIFQLSLIDSKNPTISLQKKDIKIARCFYQTLSHSKPRNNVNPNTNRAWNLQLTKCEIYNDKIKNHYKFAQTASFNQAKESTPSYLRMLKDKQPMICGPKVKL